MKFLSCKSNIPGNRIFAVTYSSTNKGFRKMQYMRPLLRQELIKWVKVLCMIHTACKAICVQLTIIKQRLKAI